MICVTSMSAIAESWPNTDIHDLGRSVSSGISNDVIGGIINTFEKSNPSLVVSFLGKDNNLDGLQMKEYVEALSSFADSGATVQHVDTQWDGR